MASDRDRLVNEHLPLVYAIASKLKRKLGKTLEEGDLVGYGTQGLIEAAKKFDPSHGTPFAAFAYHRIRGAMFDGMRTMGWYSRSDCARFRAEERAGAYLAAAGEREAAEKLADASAASKDKAAILQDIADLLSGVVAVHITCIESASEIPDERFKAPDATLLEGEARAQVRAALAALPEKERQLMELYYFADMSLESAGAKLGLSKSWASRLHARAVNLLRDTLGGAVHEAR
jgi:RNA polymerase sigma factor for flagellar operon FliA